MSQNNLGSRRREQREKWRKNRRSRNKGSWGTGRRKSKRSKTKRNRGTGRKTKEGRVWAVEDRERKSGSKKERERGRREVLRWRGLERLHRLWQRHKTF